MTTARVVSPIQSIIPSAPACARAPKTGNGAVRTAPGRRAGFQPAGYPGILPGVGMVLFRGRPATGGWEAASTGRQDACPTPPGETADLLALRGLHPKIKVLQRGAGKSADLRTRFKVAATTMKSGKGQRDAGKRSLAKFFTA